MHSDTTSSKCARALYNREVRILLLALAVHTAFAAPAIRLTPHLTVIPGPVNGALLTQSNKTLAIYGDPRPSAPQVEKVLFTHHRRDVAWAGTALVARGAEAIYPAAEEPLFTAATDFWAKYTHYHDYANQSTRVLISSIPPGRAVHNGDHIDWNGLSIEVRDTPGYTRGAVSYLFTIDGKRIACVGDLIYGDGHILDLFSLQDAIPEAKEDGYHGYAARAGQVITSLHQIAAWHPDLLIPARGPIIRSPQQAIDKLTARLQDAFASYFAVTALRWYRGDDKLQAQARRIVSDRPVAWMPMSQTANPPDWVEVISNTRVIVSSSGAAFVVDCGNRRILDQIKQLNKPVEGIWVTHYHDDHTNFVRTASEELKAPVFSSPEMVDILRNPNAYKMPCLTANAIHNVTAIPEGTVKRWHEFEFTHVNFPGQTLYHDGLLVKKDGGESVFFIGDSFTPSGIDDYCALNRNFVAPEAGYEYCLTFIKKIKPDWLINQHVNPAFHFSDAQLDTMLANLKIRRSQLAALFPWDDPNFGLDEQWAHLYPYRSDVKAGAEFDLTAVIINHSPRAREYTITPHVPPGWTLKQTTFKLVVGPRQTGQARIPVIAARKGEAIITADVQTESETLIQWLEAFANPQ